MFAAITLIVVAVANSASAGNSWSFVMLGDTRGENDTFTGISTNLNTLAQKIASLNPKPQLVIVAGDLCNGNCLNTNSHWYPLDTNFNSLAMKSVYAEFFANWKTAMQPVFDYTTSNGIPIYTVRGNHESNDTGQAPIEVLKEAYKEAFSSYVPANGPSNSPADDERGFSWSLTTNNVTFVAADQYFNFDPTSTNTPWSGYHYLDQAWVTQKLGQSTSPYKIVITHEPVFQTVGNGPTAEEQENEVAQHFFGTNNAAMQTRSNFWNDIGDAGAQVFLCGHLHLETVASTTNNHGHTIIHLLAGNGGAPPQEFIDNPEPGVTTFYNNGNIVVTNGTNPSVQAHFGFALATVTDEIMTIQYYSLDPTNSSPTTNSWTVATYITQITSARAQPILSLPFDASTGTFSYTRQDPAGTGLSYQIEKVSDLMSTWSVDAEATQTVTAITNNLQTVQVTLSGLKPLTGPSRFVRVVAQ
jgi:hypothetical protein